MPPRSRKDVDSMTFMALMDEIGIGPLTCNCSTCSGERKARPGLRTAPSSKPSGNENSKPVLKEHTHSGTCSHGYPLPSPPSLSTTKRPSQSQTQNKTATTTSTTSHSPTPAPQGRESKINNLLRACNEKAIFEVFNATIATAEEKELASLIQNVTKDSKIYQEVKDKILEVCDDDDIDLEAVFGLLVKFRHERNLLVTAILKSNTERERSNTEKDKALLCVKRVDDLMYMLQDVAKRPKDADGDTFMHKLGDIIMEIHDLAKAPSSLYDELLDIKEEHFQLVDDHEDMHQKFVDVNSCHDKLHSNHDKLQTSHTKLKEEYNEVKKKASMLGSLKGDVSRLEAMVDKGRGENTDLKKEVERLTAELAKVNALKHENAQLKKKITTISVAQQSSVTEDIASLPAPQPIPSFSPAPTSSATPVISGKKKKGKKGQNTSSSVPEPAERDKEGTHTIPDSDAASTTAASNQELTKLKRSHDLLNKELQTLKENLTRIEMLRQQAETTKDQALEKLQLEQATSQNWQGIAQDHANEKGQLKTRLQQSEKITTKLQSTIARLEESMSQLTKQISEQKEAHVNLKAELDRKTKLAAVPAPVQITHTLSQDTVQLLTKMKAETTQLIGDLEESESYGGDPHVLLKMIQMTVREVACQVEKDIEQILDSKSVNETVSSIPEAILPFGYGLNTARYTSNQSTPMNPRAAEYSPHPSPHMSYSSSTQAQGTSSHRPLIPPGFGEPSPASSSLHSYSRATDSRIFNATPSSTSSFLNTSPGHMHATQHNALPLNPGQSLGPIGSGLRSTSSNTSMPKVSSVLNKPTTTPSPIGTPAPNAKSGTGSLGNGAVGVDWSMWSKATK